MIIYSKEKWRDVTGYEGYYRVSDFGRVFSHDRLVRTKAKNGKWSTRKRKGKILSCGVDCRGYHRLNLIGENGKRTELLHRLVATAFIPVIVGSNHVNHMDSNPRNNHVSNLEWCTHLENMRHAVAMKRGVGRPSAS